MKKTHKASLRLAAETVRSLRRDLLEVRGGLVSNGSAEAALSCKVDCISGLCWTDTGMNC